MDPATMVAVFVVVVTVAIAGIAIAIAIEGVAVGIAVKTSVDDARLLSKDCPGYRKSSGSIIYLIHHFSYLVRILFGCARSSYFLFCFHALHHRPLHVNVASLSRLFLRDAYMCHLPVIQYEQMFFQPPHPPTPRPPRPIWLQSTGTLFSVQKRCRRHHLRSSGFSGLQVIVPDTAVPAIKEAAAEAKTLRHGGRQGGY